MTYKVSSGTLSLYSLTFAYDEYDLSKNEDIELNVGIVFGLINDVVSFKVHSVPNSLFYSSPFALLGELRGLLQLAGRCRQSSGCLFEVFLEQTNAT